MKNYESLLPVALHLSVLRLILIFKDIALLFCKDAGLHQQSARYLYLSYTCDVP